MDAKKIQDTRQRLASEYESLARAMNRTRRAAEEIKHDDTEDEGDLAVISHEREILYNLNESDFARLRFIQAAMRAVDRGDYGECVRCGEDINDKRLDAVPWATTCIRCQEQMEAEPTYSRMVFAVRSGDEAEL